MHISLHNLHGCMSRRRLFLPQSRLELLSAMGAHGPWPQKSSSSNTAPAATTVTAPARARFVHCIDAGLVVGRLVLSRSRPVLALTFTCHDDKAPYSTYEAAARMTSR